MNDKVVSGRKGHARLHSVSAYSQEFSISVNTQSCGKHCWAQGVMHLTIVLVQLRMRLYTVRRSSKSALQTCTFHDETFYFVFCVLYLYCI